MVPVRFLFPVSASLHLPKSFISCHLGKLRVLSGPGRSGDDPEDDLGDEGGSVWTVQDGDI